MFKQVIKSGIPIVYVRTSDVLNLPTVLDVLTEEKIVKPWMASVGKSVLIENDTLYYAEGNTELYNGLYKKLSEKNSNLVVVNADEVSPLGFDAGELPIPRTLIANLLRKVTQQDDVSEHERAVTGLTMKQVGEAVRLAETIFGSHSPSALMRVRSMVTGPVSGLDLVSNVTDYYVPTPALAKYVTMNDALFLDEEVPPLLVPRGLMFWGKPGTGKTAGAKFVAHSFGVPLYRYDLSKSLNKYVGESEKNLSRALELIDREEPCVFLLDEVDKMFAKDDTGTTSRMMAQLLWWLQEHRTRVFTIMTCNNVDVVPEELYRPGRIDASMVFHGLTKGAGIEFGVDYAFKVFGVDMGGGPVEEAYSKAGMTSLTQAEIIEAVKAQVKLKYQTKGA